VGVGVIVGVGVGVGGGVAVGVVGGVGVGVVVDGAACGSDWQCEFVKNVGVVVIVLLALAVARVLSSEM